MQRCWYITVRDRGLEGFLAEANYVDTWSDQTLSMEIERKTLKIKKAELEVHRGHPDSLPIGPVASLEGLTAYFGSGRQLKQALEGDAALLDMAAEAVTAVIQAEPYFFGERGFTSAFEYEDWWDEANINSCIYHSNLDRRGQRFMEYIKDQLRGTNLYQRIVVTSIDNSGEAPDIRSCLMDSSHEMILSLRLNKSNQIEKASAVMTRCPDPVCREALGNLTALVGMPLNTADLKRYQAICGGADGCTHITHLVQEAAHTLEVYEKNKPRPRQ